MAKTLPARGAFSNPDGVEMFYPGETHVEADVGDVVEGQHYVMAYYGRQHVPSQCWPSSRVTTSSGSYVLVLEYSIEPWLEAVGLGYRFRAQGDAGTGSIKIEVFDSASVSLGVTETSIASGTAYYQRSDAGTDTLSVNNPDEECLVQVSLKTTTATDVHLLSFAMWDADLTAGTLP